MTEGLARKKRIRAGHRGSATRMLNLTDDLMLSADTIDVARLAQLKLSLGEKLETLKHLDGEILELSVTVFMKRDHFRQNKIFELLARDCSP